MKTWKKLEQQIPIKTWCDDLEDKAVEQANNLVKLPFAFHHIAIMADSHCGYGVPIGGVLSTKGAIIPNAVGVDIGCGVSAYQSNLKASSISKEQLKDIMGLIRERVPVGFNSHKEPKQLPSGLNDEPEVPFAHLCLSGLSIKSILEKATYQAGTLGGGNHFIELQKDQNDYVWIMVHSGSRNIGYTIANYFNELAVGLNEKWFIDTKDELAFFPDTSVEAKGYLIAMNYARLFALFNRELIMKQCVSALRGKSLNDLDQFSHYDLSHNFVQLENHFGENVWVHRKGATQARQGDICLIPGSQGSNSYIGRGLGNPESFNSCSHGAGRKLSRSKARKELNLEKEQKLLDNLGVIHSVRNESDLDEAPSSYKDIHTVMEAQKDLVEIVNELTPIGVIKG